MYYQRPFIVSFIKMKISNNDIKYKPIKHDNTTTTTTTTTNDETSKSNGNGIPKLNLIKYPNTKATSLEQNELNVQRQREFHSLIIFLFFLFITIITLSQILVMHSQTNNTNFYQIKLMQEELRLMDYSIDKMLKENDVLPMQLWYSLKQYKDNIKKFHHYLTFISNYTSDFNCDYYINSTYLNKDNVAAAAEDDDVDESTGLLNRNLFDNNNNNTRNIECLKSFLLNITNKIDNNKKKNNANNRLIHQLFMNSSSTFGENREMLIKSVINRISSLNASSVVANGRRKNNLKDYCDQVPSDLKGDIYVEDKRLTVEQLNFVEQENNVVEFGGMWKPSNCQSRHRVGIIIPYRDRKEHLITLLSYLHPILRRQEIEYRVFVVEQEGNGTFNKAILMNSAFIYAYDHGNYDCYCFHDVDLVPENDRNMYSCPRFPRHMSVAIDEMNYKLQYEELVGGVFILRTEHLITINGYSNLYWGWGAEDDDLYYRLKGAGLKVERPPLKIGRYKMMKHQKRKPQLWSKRAKLLYSSVNRMTWDGISSVKYRLINVTLHKLYTHLLVNVGEPPVGFS